MQKFIWIVLFFIILNSCSKNEEVKLVTEPAAETLNAKFSIVANDPLNIFESQTIRFVNESTGYNLCSWQFGNNTKSPEINPEKSYPYHGVYTVTLTVYDDKGNRSTYTKDVSILCNFGAGITH